MPLNIKLQVSGAVVKNSRTGDLKRPSKTRGNGITLAERRIPARRGIGHGGCSGFALERHATPPAFTLSIKFLRHHRQLHPFCPAQTFPKIHAVFVILKNEEMAFLNANAGEGI